MNVPLPVSIDAMFWIIRASGVVLAAVAATPWAWNVLTRWKVLETTLWASGIAGLAFAATFVVAAPFSLWRLAFLKGLYYEAVETGADLSLQWTRSWTQGNVAAMGWPIVTAIVRFAPVHEMLFHSAIPLVGPAAILAAGGLVALSETLAARAAFPRRTLELVVAGAFVACEWRSFTSLYDVRRAAVERSRAPQVVVGDWLADRVPTSSRIVYDYGSYVPPEFSNATGGWGGSREWLSVLNPDVIVANRDVATTWPGRSGPSYHAWLDSGLSAYLPVLKVDRFTVYERRTAVTVGLPLDSE